MIPADKILENQYTYGNDYTFQNGDYYKGYYCVISGTKYYTGKTYNNTSKQLFKVEPKPIQSDPKGVPPQSNPIRYFIRKVNVFPIIIKEVDEQTYTSFKLDPFYQTAAIESDQDIAQADSQIPGLKSFLEG